MSVNTSSVTLRREGAIGVLKLERAHGNAINGELVDALFAALAEAEADPEIRGVLFTSAGKLFSPGLDLQELFLLDRRSMEHFMRRFTASMLALYVFPKPVVASIHGHALAGGCVIGLCCDWRVLRRGALVGLNEVKVGVPLPFGVALIVRDAVPRNRVDQVALLGRNHSDEAALDAGLADELADDGRVESTARARLDEFISKDAVSLAITKRYLRSPVVERVRANDHQLLAEWLDAWFSPGTRERIAAIVEELKGKRG